MDAAARPAVGGVAVAQLVFEFPGVAPAGSALVMARRRRSGPTRAVWSAWAAVPPLLPRLWGMRDGEGLVAVHAEKQVARAAAAAAAAAAILTSVQT